MIYDTENKKFYPFDCRSRSENLEAFGESRQKLQEPLNDHVYPSVPPLFSVLAFPQRVQEKEKKITFGFPLSASKLHLYSSLLIFHTSYLF